MKKAYFFFTCDELHRITIRGAEGQHKWDKLDIKEQVKSARLGGMVTSIVTIFKTLEELTEALNSTDSALLR